MSTTTRYKYIAIGVNVFVIVFSVWILVSLYLYSISSEHQIDIDSTGTTAVSSSSLIGNTSTIDANHSENQEHKTLPFLPCWAKSFINWLGQSVLASGGDVVASDSAITSASSSALLATGRPLIAICFLSYVLAIVASIAIGLEHVTLLILLIAIYALLFAVSVCAVVFSYLGSIVQHNLIWFDFWNSLLLVVIVTTGIEVYVTSYLVYVIYMERRAERSNEYCLAKVVSNVSCEL